MSFDALSLIDGIAEYAAGWADETALGDCINDDDIEKLEKALFAMSKLIDAICVFNERYKYAKARLTDCQTA